MVISIVSCIPVQYNLQTFPPQIPHMPLKSRRKAYIRRFNVIPYITIPYDVKMP